ncbi:olfactory receptor 6B1-like [Rhinatrema bivittatum]|uniref:olfactory receptor 6B1-like n=1 Tax=Rhinatrema bivittatum TaxID=194408 RepID=UPI0011275208|nr:olfactory receptor 6B1-like [Rhinatrema bivittatum]
MEKGNETVVTEFILRGFPTSLHTQVALFLIFLFAYIFTVIENMVIILMIVMNRKLHKPMYFFLCNLSFMEMWYITVTVPNLLVNLVTEKKIISFSGCMAQLFFFISLMSAECVILAVMAFDRYVAICYPLRYSIIMSNRLCIQLAAVAWISGFTITVIKISFISRLSFCGANVINHFFCDISPVLNLACMDMSLAEQVDFILALVILLTPLTATVVSYIAIVAAILKIPSNTGRKKAFSTCASHLTVVTIFYSATLYIYARPKKISAFDINKLISVLYAVITPVINPIIYCLRNKEVKEVLRNSRYCNILFPRKAGDSN